MEQVVIRNQESGYADVIDDWQAVVAATMVAGTAKDISGKKDVLLYVEAALVEAVAHGTGVQIIVETSQEDDNWVELTKFRGTAETAATTTINDAAAAAGDSTITLTDATTGDFDVKARKWFILEATYANSESVKTISNATHVVTLAQDMIRAHTNGASCYDRVDEWQIAIPDNAKWVRVLANNDDADCDIAFTSRIGWVNAR